VEEIGVKQHRSDQLCFDEDGRLIIVLITLAFGRMRMASRR
jgi:hypothetical protein